MKQLGARPGDVARADRQHDITGPYAGGKRLGEATTLSAPGDLPARPAHGRIDEIGRDPVDGLLARGIDLGEIDRIRLRERIAELRREVSRARVEVRLECRDD